MKSFKKIFSILVLSLFVGASAFAFKDDGNIHLTTGSGGTIGDPIRIYQLARYPGVSANDPGLSIGDVVVSDAVSKDGVTVNLVGVGTSVDAVVGVVVSPTIPSADQAGTQFTDIGHRNWGYIQTYGICSVDVVSGPAVAGAVLVASTFQRYATSPSGTVNQRTFGFAYSTSNGGIQQAFVATN